MNIDYKCKFCGQDRSVEIPDSDGTMIQVEKWKKMLCCNRCGDFHTRKNTLTEKIRSVCIMLINLRHTSSKNASEIESKIRDKLTFLSRQYAELCCDYFLKETVWDVAFVDMLCDKPDKFYKILGNYFHSARTVK